ncbi:hypothetical protein GA0070606_3781 [Micromonospora citrea]|uniref:Uncharacterized protein n=1 Tax=Micromonospora citrea TaxID=47855 RepID=A0A1C6VAK8_9ACTN|nr:hypothetical protein [Micromonospora citrea]SCL63363.1 hypothetical protein GA0070606_3781 [Micromonospora citrea]
MNGVVEAGQAPSTGPGRPASPRRWLPWLLAGTVAWAVLLAALTWTSVRDDPPTVREQRTLTEAGPVVDRAVGELFAAAGDTAVPTPPEVERGCRVTPFAEGATLTRGVDVFVPVGSERELLERVADRLPGSWRAGVRVTSDDGPRLRADAGEFVTVSGRVDADGRVRLTADTGCRPVGDGYVAPAVGADGGQAEALAGALRALGAPAGPAPALLGAPCPAGGAVRTARAAAVAAPASPAAVLAPVAGVPLLDTAHAYAYRRGDVVVVADLSGDSVVVSATTGCAA